MHQAHTASVRHERMLARAFVRCMLAKYLPNTHPAQVRWLLFGAVCVVPGLAGARSKQAMTLTRLLACRCHTPAASIWPGRTWQALPAAGLSSTCRPAPRGAAAVQPGAHPVSAR